jgi:16S rRNA processing protein RimM
VASERRPDRTAGERIVVGRLAGAFGVRGEVRLKSFCAEPAAIAGYAPLHAPDGRAFRSLVITGETAGALTARVEGIASKEEADALRGTDLLADRSRLPALAEDEFYHADLVGLPVHDPGGTLLGEVLAVLNHGAGDILEVARPGGSTVLIPFTLAAVPLVDLAARRIVADPPEGSL